MSTKVVGVQFSRWQVFASDGEAIYSYNLEQSAEGLFNVAGTQLYTSPDPRFAGSVLERAPGIDSNTMRPLVPVAVAKDRGGTALRFEGSASGPVIAGRVAMAVPQGPYTVEAWIRPTAPRGLIVARTDASTFGTPVYVSLNAAGNLVFGHGAQTLTSTAAVPMGVYAHVAAVFDGAVMRLFLDGAAVGTCETTAAVAVTAQLFIGKRMVSGTASPDPFTGEIDEVRIWGVERTDFTDRARRLVGTEPGLFAYFPFDEGAGRKVSDRTDNRFSGTLGPSPVWVTSQAPLYEGPGVSRTSFAVSGRTVTSGLSATLYFQQEPAVTGYAVTASQEKRQARVLLAFATAGPPPQGEPADRSYVASVDCALTKDGRVATPSGSIDLAWVGRPDPTADIQKLGAAQAAVTAARGQLANDQALSNSLDAYTARLNYLYDKVYGGTPGFTLRDLNRNIVGPARNSQREEERNYLAEAATLEPLKAQAIAARGRLGADGAALSAALNTLSTLSGGMLGAAEAVLPMPTVYTDRSGLSVLGALLSFAWTGQAPFLLDSSSGEVVLYFRGGQGQFFAVYYATTVSRAVKRITVPDGALCLTSSDAATTQADLEVTVSATGTGTRTVVITRGTSTETFTSVPERADLLAGVLNGTLSGVDLGTVLSAKDTSVTLQEPLTTTLVPGSAVTIGQESRTVASAQAGSAQITVTTGNLTPAPGTRVRTAAYDYSLASANTPGVSLARGSQLISAHAGTAVGPVAAGTAENLSEPLVPRWHGDAPGRAFSFDGTGQRLELASTANLAGLATPGDLTLEAWAFPTFVNATVRILNTELGDTRYSLGLEKAVLPSGTAGYTLLGVVNDQVVRGTEVFPLSQWGQVAMVFEQNWAIAMNGSGYLDAGGPGGLDIVDDLTLEAFVRLDSLGTVQGLIGKGAIGGAAYQAVPYSLYVEADGQLAFTFESGSGGAGAQVTHQSGVNLIAGVFYKVAVTRKNPTSPGGKVEIRFYVDKAGFTPVQQTYAGAKPVGNDAPVQLGRHRVGKDAFGLRGALAQARIWNIVRDADQIGAPITEKASGLVAWWTFAESTGAQAADRLGSYPATLYSVARVRTPDPAGNRFTLYLNGTATPAKLSPPPSLVSRDDGKSPQHSAVAGRRSPTGYGQAFTGDLDEIRVWRTARTQEQILDNMFGRIHGDREDLIAYYPFDTDDTLAGAQIRDRGLGGQDLLQSSPPPKIVLSTAPISNDSSQVRSALTGIRTPFHLNIAATPATTEYGDVQQAVHGATFGVMKRAYSHLQGTDWVLTSGYKIGELATTWVGQVQFDPQLIGYIEGAPPVPSENLVAGTATDYAGASSIAFVQADNVVNALSSSRNHSVDASVKLKFDVSVKDETFLIAAPLGVGTAKPAGSLAFDFGASLELKFSNSWTNETKVTQGTNTTRTSRVDLTGGWENPKKQVNPTAGQRWVPANTGFAVVQSETADLYALRLVHTGAIVAYRTLPSPDIPRDWNLIPFPINPRYTKQGTLDGVVGYAEQGPGKELRPFADPSFPKAADGVRGEFSYYRPAEAYRIKKRIQREQQQLQGFYESTSTETHAPDPTHGQAAKVLNGMMGGTGAEAALGTDPGKAREAARSGSRRNIVNTYVWTAAGGFFAETTGTTDQVTETTTGSFTFTGTIGGSFAVSFDVFGAGGKFGMESSYGTGYSVTRSKSKDATRTFSLDVTCTPGRQLQKHDGDTPLFDAQDRPVLVPGRVDAYRFMSIYLDTTTDNFEDFYGKVIDPEWLDRGKDPGALALQGARQSDRKPPCWRILHRVTFVSRVQDTTPTTTPSLAQAMGTLGITSDYQLIKQLEPYLAGATTNPAALTAAAKTALAAHFPTLTPYTDTITTRLADYYTTPTPPPASAPIPAPTPIAPIPAPAIPDATPAPTPPRPPR
ncbi:LamG-like jellyroll fold domain-containing protein [Streptacidiphilus sp. PAMC 29251]